MLYLWTNFQLLIELFGQLDNNPYNNYFFV